MADIYKVGLRIEVFKGVKEEKIVSDEHFFNDIPFSLLTIIGSGFYELITKLLKIK